MVETISMVGRELTFEQLSRIETAAKQPIIYTKDSPKLTDKQLAEFRPVNFDSMEERRQAMIEAGII